MSLSVSVRVVHSVTRSLRSLYLLLSLSALCVCVAYSATGAQLNDSFALAYLHALLHVRAVTAACVRLPLTHSQKGQLSDAQSYLEELKKQSEEFCLVSAPDVLRRAVQDLDAIERVGSARSSVPTPDDPPQILRRLQLRLTGELGAREAEIELQQRSAKERNEMLAAIRNSVVLDSPPGGVSFEHVRDRFFFFFRRNIS